MEIKKSRLYNLRYEVASERKEVLGYTLIPEAEEEAAEQHISDHEKFKIIQRHAQNGDLDAVKRLLSEFPAFKREDIKEILIKNSAGLGKKLEL